jgi:arylformamidase
MNRFIDISVPLHAGLPVWPGNPSVSIQQVMRMADGQMANVSHMELNVHSGTHIDAPLHFIDGGKTTAEIDLNRLLGSCQVVSFEGQADITAEGLERLNLPAGVKRLLFKTDNSGKWADPSHAFDTGFTALTLDAAHWIVDRGIELVGIDYLSIQRFEDPFDTHVVLLEKEVVILETLNLSGVEPGAYNLICLPLSAQGVEGIPARAVLEKVTT